MPPPSSGPTSTLHIYRHILREASYLPQTCRAFVTEWSKNRFRHYQHHPYPLDLKKQVYRAKHGLRLLRAANAGDLARMRRVLYLAFGRIGARRRQLMVQLRRKEPPRDSTELQKIIVESVESHSMGEGDWLDKWDTTKLQAFASSQGRQAFHESPRPEVKLKSLSPAFAVPKVNSWGRTPSINLARNKTKKWWIALADRILPPVGTGEWDMLKSLSEGTAPAASWMPPSRRIKVGHHEARKELDWIDYASTPVRILERSASRKWRMLYTSDERHGTVSGPAIGIHQMTSRTWKRLYGQVWQLTPKMDKHPTQPGKYKIEWGSRRSTKAAPSPASKCLQAVFDGVDNQGKLNLSASKDSRGR